MQGQRRGPGGRVRPGDPVWAKPPLPPSRRLNLPRLTQPLPGMGGGGSAPGPREERAGVGRGARKGASQPRRQDGPQVSSRDQSSPPTRRRAGSPEGGTGGGLGQRKERQSFIKGRSRFIGRRLCARRLIYVHYRIKSSQQPCEVGVYKPPFDR